MAFSDTKPHYALLDGLRGVAALLVVWHHVFEGYQFAGNRPYIEFMNHGYLAVDFFFILSGFVIGYAYDDRWGKRLTLGNFFKRRLIRLHPMVIMGALIGFLAFAATGFERWDGTNASLAASLLALLAAMLMIPALPGMTREVRGNGEMFPLNGPCWSLFFEYIGNVVYAFLLRFLPTRALGCLAAALCCALGWFAIADPSGYGCLGVGWTADTMNILGGMLRLLCPFTVGMFLSRVFSTPPLPFRGGRERLRCTLLSGISLARARLGDTRLLRGGAWVRGAFWWCMLVLVLLFHVPYIKSQGAVCWNGVFEAVCIIGIFPLLVWTAAKAPATDRLSTRVCKFLGDLSFPLYIVHYPLMYVFYLWLMKTEQYTFAETWPVALLVCVASVALAWVALRFFDIPVRQGLSKMFVNKGNANRMQ